MSDELVLVTGGTGYIGAECVRQLLNNGYRVRTTVRSLKREADVRAMLNDGEIKNLDKLSVVAANLSTDEGWTDAVKDCTYVLHVASPFPPGNPKDENELIIPARDGTLRVLRAARDAGVKRVVVTSSLAAIAYGLDDYSKVLTEASWSNLDSPNISAYQKSKTIAERAAWDFIEKEGGGMELATINPVGVFGPVTGKDYATSVLLIEKLINGSLPGCPQFEMGVVDVRDVADLHLRAMTNPKAAGERFLAISGDQMSLQQIAITLRERLGNKARKVPTRLLPNFLLKIASMFDPAVKLILPELGKTRQLSNEKARTVLDWTPIPREDTIVTTAESLISHGIVKV